MNVVIRFVGRFFIGSFGFGCFSLEGDLVVLGFLGLAEMYIGVYVYIL